MLIKQVTGLGEKLSSLEIIGGLTQSPNAALDLTNPITTITMSGELVVTSIVNAPPGISVRKYIHGSDPLTIMGVTDFTNKNGAYFVAILNTGTLASPVIEIYDMISSGSGLSLIQSTVLNDMIAAKPLSLTPYISGNAIKNSTLTINGNYFDPLSRAESGSTYAWYRCDDTIGTNDVLISGATSQNYTPVSADIGKVIKGVYTPANASATGSAYSTTYSAVVTGQVVLDINFITPTWADPTVPDGATKFSTHDANNNCSQVAGGLQYITDGTLTSIRFLGLIESGKTYHVEASSISVNTGSWVISLGTTVVKSMNSTVVDVDVQGVSNNTYVEIKRNVGPSVLVQSNLKVTEL